MNNKTVKQMLTLAGETYGMQHGIKTTQRTAFIKNAEECYEITTEAKVVRVILSILIGVAISLFGTWLTGVMVEERWISVHIPRDTSTLWHELFWHRLIVSVVVTTLFSYRFGPNFKKVTPNEQRMSDSWKPVRKLVKRELANPNEYVLNDQIPNSIESAFKRVAYNVAFDFTTRQFDGDQNNPHLEERKERLSEIATILRFEISWTFYFAEAKTRYESIDKGRTIAAIA